MGSCSRELGLECTRLYRRLLCLDRVHFGLGYFFEVSKPLRLDFKFFVPPRLMLHQRRILGKAAPAARLTHNDGRGFHCSQQCTRPSWGVSITTGRSHVEVTSQGRCDVPSSHDSSASQPFCPAAGRWASGGRTSRSRRNDFGPIPRPTLRLPDFRHGHREVRGNTQ